MMLMVKIFISNNFMM